MKLPVTNVFLFSRKNGESTVSRMNGGPFPDSSSVHSDRCEFSPCQWWKPLQESVRSSVQRYKPGTVLCFLILVIIFQYLLSIYSFDFTPHGRRFIFLFCILLLCLQHFEWPSSPTKAIDHFIFYKWPSQRCGQQGETATTRGPDRAPHQVIQWGWQLHKLDLICLNVLKKMSKQCYDFVSTYNIIFIFVFK